MREKVLEQFLHWYFLTSEWVCRCALKLERSANALLQWGHEKGFSPVKIYIRGFNHSKAKMKNYIYREGKYLHRGGEKLSLRRAIKFSIVSDPLVLTIIHYFILVRVCWSQNVLNDKLQHFLFQQVQPVPVGGAPPSIPTCSLGSFTVSCETPTAARGCSLHTTDVNGTTPIWLNTSGTYTLLFWEQEQD